MAKASGFFAGLIIGALIGAGIALLYAPQPGEKTREQLRSRLVGLTERARDTFRQAIEEGKAAAAARKAELESKLKEKRG